MLSYDVLIIGSGAAAYSTADWLLKFGCRNVAMITENRFAGTSRNAGSDKQTYYRPNLTDADSPKKMAEALACGGGMHGDTAYVEAINSMRCFFRLVDYGVPFPTDALGGFASYRTDHDDAARGTSAGPLTSKFMTECLERAVLSHGGVTLIDHARVVKIIIKQDAAKGVLALTESENGRFQILPVAAKYVVMATGGAADVYADSVYPHSQTGAMGLAIDAGCRMNNLSEWQYGIASTDVRWNLSGSYQQVIPRYFSVGADGVEYEFLNDAFDSPQAACDAEFLKGYQWPFDAKKADGSSRIDIAVCGQRRIGREVFLDYTRNPQGYCFRNLSAEAQDYLAGADATGELPIDRLVKLNAPAIDFYRSRGIDLTKEPIRIAVCAQHINGGVDVDLNYMTSINRLFAAGEVAGTFGLYRPGGSALNATQVAGLRVAEYICGTLKESEQLQAQSDEEAFYEDIRREQDYINRCMTPDCADMTDFRAEMSRCAAHSRVYEEVENLLHKIHTQIKKRYYKVNSSDFCEIQKLYLYRDNIRTQEAVCRTLYLTMSTVGSRGGAVVFREGKKITENSAFCNCSITTTQNDVCFTALRPFPYENEEKGFENVWRAYRIKKQL